jgi:hypothetical protein
MTDYTNGKWHAMTLGEFIAIMVDSGNDPAVLIRVTKDEPSQDKSFIRHLEVMIIPQGKVIDTIQQVQPDSIHKVLVALINGGVIE